MERRMLVSLRGTVTLYTTSSQGSLNLMDKSSSFILHQPPCCHRIAHSCQLCEPTPFAVIQKLEQEASAQFVDPESDIAVNHIQAVKTPQKVRCLPCEMLYKLGKSCNIT